MIQKSIISPFDITVEEGLLKIVIFEDLRDCPWAAYFGEIQQALRHKLLRTKPIDKCLFDFSNCNWADPLPLLYFILVATEFTDNGGKLNLILPEVNEKSARFLKYLGKEGFLDLFNDISESISDNLGLITKDKIEGYKDLSAQLAYVDSTLIPAQLFKVTSYRTITDWAEKNHDLLVSLLISKVPGWTIDDILYRLKTFLFESSFNIFDHAYPNGGNRYAAIYVRYRKGLIGINQEERKALQPALKNESDNDICPCLPLYFFKSREGCLEATVADIGVGMSNTLSSIIKTKKGKTPKRLFPHACELVFIDGMHKKSSEYLTRCGGLHLLGRLLSENNDFIRGRDEDSWYGDVLPLHRKSTFAHHLASGKDHCGMSVEGLSWTTRLSWLAPTDTGDSGFWKKWKGECSKNPVFQELQSNEIDIGQFRGISFRDERFEKYLGWLGNVEIKGNEKQHIYLVKPGRSKIDILDSLENISSKFTPNLKLNLVIGDIPSHEAVTYAAALNKLKVDHRQKWPAIFSKITLITQQLSVFGLTYKKSSNGFEYREEFTDSLYSTGSSKDFDPSANIRHYIRWLRHHDSDIFWRHIIEKHPDDHTYIGGKIRWSIERKEINGYLDFVQTLTDTLLRHLYKITLERLPCLKHDAKCKLVAMDNHVRDLVNHYNSTILPRLSGKNEFTIYIGSVEVTGFTRDMAVFGQASTEYVPIHFFRHIDSDFNTAHLLLWPQQDWFKKHFEPEKADYKRIDKSGVIAKGGLSCFQLPRFDKDKQSFYGRSPKDTYDDWQDPNPCIMKIGHWRYESNHDLLTVNLWNALKYSFATWGNLSCFLMGCFFNALGIKNQKYLTSDGREWLKKIRENNESKVLKACAIIYPSHPNTDNTISYLLASVNEEIRKKIIAVRPIRKTRGRSAFLISPSVIERIKTLINASQSKSILIFDDALISGRTNSELEYLLRSIGAQKIQTLVILERRRLPGIASQEEKALAYWRLDVPVIGNKLTCPICRVLDKTEQFSTYIISREAKNRIGEWQREWEMTSPLTDWTSHGLTPVAVNLLSPRKRFSTYQNDLGKYCQIGGEEQRIVLKRSIGLTTFASELHSMVFRDDYVVETLMRETHLNEPAIVEMITSQLILFGEEFTSEIRHKLLMVLFKTVNKFDDVDRHSSLAAVTFFIQNEATLNVLVGDLYKSGELDRMILNTDLAIVVAYSIHLFPDFTQLTGPGIEGAQRLLKQKVDSNFYHRLHLETYSKQGKAHTKALTKFIDEPFTEKAVLIINALNTIDHLKYLIKKINFIHLRINKSDEEPSKEETSKEFLEGIDNKLDDTYQLIKDLKDQESEEDVAFAKTKVKQLIKCLDQLHDKLFFPLAIAGINRNGSRSFDETELITIPSNYTEDKIKNLRGEKDKLPYSQEMLHLSISGEPFPTEDREESWVIWDASVKEIVDYLVMNVRHSNDPIRDYWHHDEGLAHMWMHVKYGRDFLTILLANSSSFKADYVIHETKSKGRFLHLEDLGGKVTYEDSNIDEVAILVTKIQIPYAG
ncbi:hypothetical protein [Desulfobacula sp.]|uniref:hypothetical protein n=1 Tax=Desulfobacula sp. TaxID=2593537 RepID=UPI002606334E|nr:hypothetical protein [Desulfobacula sp.]